MQQVSSEAVATMGQAMVLVCVAGATVKLAAASRDTSADRSEFIHREGAAERKRLKC